MDTKQVKVLNERIEAINTQKTREESKREVLLQNLKKSVEAYESSYGVSLKDKSLSKMSKNIENEMGKVTSEITKEYELKEAVVSAIENGDMEEANRLLGITVTKEPEEVEEEVINEEPEETINEEVNSSEDSSEDWDLEVEDGTPEQVDEPEDDSDDWDLEVDDDNDTEEPDEESDEEVSDMLGDVDDDFGFGDLLSGSRLDI